MKRTLLPALLIISILSGCSSVYKSGQTPDDVYYSPGRNVPTRKEMEDQKERRDQYDEYVSVQDDRFLRMKVANRSRWGLLDDFNYWYDSRYDFSAYAPYSYSAYNNYYGISNPYWRYGFTYGAYNPYLGGYDWNCPVYTLIGYAYPNFYEGATSGSNISAYKNKTYNNVNLGYTDPKTGNWINTGSTNNFGSLVKKVFSPASNGNPASTYDRAARTFSTPTNTSVPSTSSNAGGSSAGFKSTGSSSSAPRSGKN